MGSRIGNLGKAATVREPFHRGPVMRASTIDGWVVLLTAGSVAAQERMMLTATDDALSAILQKINNERVRIDVASWYFTDHSISIALVNRFRAGVPVRVIGDWLPAIFG